MYSVVVAPVRTTQRGSDGVCSFFENSTVCRMSVPCLFDPCGLAGSAVWWVWLGLGFFELFLVWLVIRAVPWACLRVCSWVLFSVGHSTESLILAQDERWRRA